MREHRMTHGSDLVGRIAIRGDAVGTDDDRIHLALGHDGRRHVVADERRGYARADKLPRGETTALVDGTRFARVDVLDQPAVVCREDDAERGAVEDGCQRTGVAVRHDARSGREDTGAMGSDEAIRLLVLRFHPEREVEKARLETRDIHLGLAGELVHVREAATHRPAEIHSGRTGVAHDVANNVDGVEE